MDPLSTAIKVGGSLLGGLLGRKSSKQTNTVDYARLRRDAEAAGFNPLTALIHGGAAGFTQTSAPPLQTAGLIMDAANALSDHYKAPDPVAVERERLEQELLKARIDALQGSARSTGVMGSTMAASVSTDDIEETGNQYGAGRRVTMDGQLRPQARIGSGRWDLVPMQLPDGSLLNIRRDILDQAGLTGREILTGQILEELMGEAGDMVGASSWALGGADNILRGYSHEERHPDAIHPSARISPSPLVTPPISSIGGGASGSWDGQPSPLSHFAPINIPQQKPIPFFTKKGQ